MRGSCGSLPEANAGEGLESRADGGCHGGALHMSVLATQSVIADAQHVPNDTEAVTQRMDFGAVVMAPGDGDFSHLEVQTQGKKEDLSVKAPPLHFLRRKNGASSVTGEGLEAALGVLLRKGEDRAQEQIKRPARDLAIKRL